MSTLAKFNKLITNDYNINQLQNNVSTVVDSLSIQPLITGTLLKGVVLATGNNTIYHNLGAPLQGYIVTTVNAPVTIYNAGSSTPDKTLTLHSSGNATINLVVF